MRYEDEFEDNYSAPGQSQSGASWAHSEQRRYDDMGTSILERAKAPMERAPDLHRRDVRNAPSAQDDAWNGQSLADAFAPKKAAPPPAAASGGSSGSRGGPPPQDSASKGGQSNKRPEEIVAWVRTLPESHVPEKCRENIAAIIEESRMSGQDFTAYVQRVPPEICGPKHAMKLKAAWNNVLAEAAAAEVARQNANNSSLPKATVLVVPF